MFKTFSLYSQFIYHTFIQNIIEMFTKIINTQRLINYFQTLTFSKNIPMIDI